VLANFKGQRWTHQDADSNNEEQTKAAEQFGLRLALGRHERGLGRDVIHFGDNSGYQAINLAYLLGAGRILLLGYDMQARGSQTHFFGDHPPPLKTGSDYRHWVTLFDRLAQDLVSEGVEVINCTRETALRCFARSTLNEAL
jgi:hypothetical protein